MVIRALVALERAEGDMHSLLVVAVAMEAVAVDHHPIPVARGIDDRDVPVWGGHFLVRRR